METTQKLNLTAKGQEMSEKEKKFMSASIKLHLALDQAFKLYTYRIIDRTDYTNLVKSTLQEFEIDTNGKRK